ncbi:hypothetical protein GH714_014919 [Hevea brasiliensis]|uniref:Protein FAR1-RELATED SEQUENCE n=1 Tax=Hevea brasiliensis TaxID=3981 RepID=A0A6A6MZT6_HEVBR|nr:hypothetical protein GH714_014919 [Hevea brasiliensis]
MHAYFDGFVNSRSTLKQFVEQYKIAMRDKNEKELQAEHKSRYTVIKCKSHFRFEKQFQRCFTNSMFKQVQDEIQRIMYYHVLPPNADDNVIDPPLGVEVFMVREKSLINHCEAMIAHIKEELLNFDIVDDYKGGHTGNTNVSDSAKQIDGVESEGNEPNVRDPQVTQSRDRPYINRLRSHREVNRRNTPTRDTDVRSSGGDDGGGRGNTGGRGRNFRRIS